MAESEDGDDAMGEDARPLADSADLNAEAEPSKRKTFMIFGRDQTPAGIAAALNAERERQLALKEALRRQAAAKDPDET
jgi:hypothetical protein